MSPRSRFSSAGGQSSASVWNQSPSRDEKLIPQTQLEIGTRLRDVTTRVLRFSDFTERLMLVGVFENKQFVVRCSDSEKKKINIKFLRIQHDRSFTSFFYALMNVAFFIPRVSRCVKRVWWFYTFYILNSLTNFHMYFHLSSNSDWTLTLIF